MSIIEYELRKDKQNGRPYLREIREFENTKIDGGSPEDIFEFMQSAYEVDTMIEEEVYILFLSSQMKVIAVSRVAHGGFCEALFSKREILCRALILGTIGLILVHNHPGGNCKPSEEDIKVTKELEEACNIVGLRLIDHVILTDKNVFSCRREGVVRFR